MPLYLQLKWWGEDALDLRDLPGAVNCQLPKLGPLLLEWAPLRLQTCIAAAYFHI